MNATRAEIAELLGQGLSNKAIAKYLHVRHTTVSEIRYSLGLPNVAPRNAQCGTDRGVDRHRRRGEQLCDPCRHAHDWAEQDRQADEAATAAAAAAAATERGTDMTINLAEFTPRERQIFHCLRRGLTAAQIAAHLQINDRTVHHHTRALCQRLGVATRAEAARIAQAYQPAPEPAKPRGGDWRHRAACREEDPELFFPIGNTGPSLLQIEEAKAVCRGCSVREECLQYAFNSGSEAGVFGGLSEDERRAMKRRSARQRARTGTA